MKAPSILNRIIALHLAAFFGISVAIVAAAFLLLTATVDKFEESVLRMHAQTISQYLSYRDGRWRLALPPALAPDYRSGSGDFALAVVSNSGETLASTFPEPVLLPLSSNIGVGGVFSYQHIGPSVFYQLILAKQSGSQTAWILVGQNLSNPNVIVDDVLSGFAGELIWIVFPMLAIILLVDILFLRRLFRPVVAASQIAASVQPDSVPARLPMIQLPREVLPLAVAFNQALDRLEKALRAQREFTADAAHELRTPLSILRAEIDVSLDAQSAYRLHSDIDAMSHVLDQLLELAELEGESLHLTHAVDLSRIATDVVSLMAPLALAQDRTIELSLPTPTEIMVPGDEHMLARALRNLIENAIRYTPRAGSVMIEVQGPAMLIVSDDGPGILPSDRALVFKRFWRRKHECSGNAGLGLAIVAKIVELHGGKVDVSDSPSGGAKFTVYLPAV